jgi:DNA helicase-2/ATP-dependent DNA helicase PcrA
VTEPISAVRIADELGRPHPTAEQIAVIEAPLAPALVVAGAGSGKTETMAYRVLWLLANGHVKAPEVLGLTFTRKAAGELGARIRERIGQLAAKGLIPDYDEFDPPTVATYNSFANTIFRDHAALLGRESDGAVLSEASAWQLARSIVIAADDDRLPDLGKNVDTVTKAVLSLSHAMSENVATPADVVRFAEQFAGLAELPQGDRHERRDAVTLAETVGALPVLVRLAEQFAEAKRQRGFVEYSDQVALALELVRTRPLVGDALRERHRVILLDEYQDTSVVQSWLLSELFGGQAVMAVGDPNQSIYGWRGASASNLEQFAAQYGGGAALEFSLSTSWRNGHRILDVANGLVASTGQRVQRLQPGSNATSLPVDIVVEEMLPDEARAAARWLKERLVADAEGKKPSAAMLFRTRGTQRFFIQALREERVPFHVLGIGGLMAEPEIADLHALSRVASWLSKRDYRQQELPDDVREALRSSVASGEGGSIIDALDFVATAKPGHVALENFSELGLERLRDAGQLFERLRARSGLDLLDFVTFVEQELLLDIEVAANEARPLGGASMEAFFDALGGYLAVDDTSSLSGFLSWLREAEFRDSLAPRPEEPEPGTVQLLTIHGSKGLEWDLVVVPRFTKGELPGTPNEGYTGWLSFGALPYEFRGDASELPEFEWRDATNRKELLEARDRFKAKVQERYEREERRLAYVAVTRARHSLLLTSSFWSLQSKPRDVSPFLRELEQLGVIGELPTASEYDANPIDPQLTEFDWPRDPLGGRRAAVEWAAQQVRSTTPGAAGEWDRELDLLLEERRRRLESSELVEVPTRVPASRFKDFVTDPASVATSLRRPMPQRPYRATRLGTLFHSWVEERFGVTGATEVIDALSIELDEGDELAEAERLEALKATFEASPWAARKPVEVEREIHLPFDGRVVICKIDAVYEQNGRYEVVDWKTGKAPRDAEDLEHRQLQLALYRLAYAHWTGIDPELIDAVFYFVADDRVIRPERLYDERELIELWRAAIARR